MNKSVLSESESVEFKRSLIELVGSRHAILDTTVKTTDITTDKNSIHEKAILELITANPSFTQKEMVVRLKLTEDSIYYHIARLKAKAALMRVGGKKAGRWEVKG